MEGEGQRNRTGRRRDKRGEVGRREKVERGRKGRERSGKEREIIIVGMGSYECFSVL